MTDHTESEQTAEINGKTYPITGYAEDGLPIIKATAESTHSGFDKDGNPIISVNVFVSALPQE